MAKVVRLYLYDETPESLRVLELVRAATGPREGVRLEIVDVKDSALEAIKEGVFATPMIIALGRGIVGLPSREELEEIISFLDES